MAAAAAESISSRSSSSSSSCGAACEARGWGWWWWATGSSSSGSEGSAWCAGAETAAAAVAAYRSAWPGKLSLRVAAGRPSSLRGGLGERTHAKGRGQPAAGQAKRTEPRPRRTRAQPPPRCRRCQERAAPWRAVACTGEAKTHGRRLSGGECFSRLLRLSCSSPARTVMEAANLPATWVTPRNRRPRGPLAASSSPASVPATASEEEARDADRVMRRDPLGEGASAAPAARAGVPAGRAIARRRHLRLRMWD